MLVIIRHPFEWLASYIRHRGNSETIFENIPGFVPDLRRCIDGMGPGVIGRIFRQFTQSATDIGTVDRIGPDCVKFLESCGEEVDRDIWLKLEKKNTTEHLPRVESPELKRLVEDKEPEAMNAWERACGYSA